MTGTCSIDGCDRRAHCRGWCRRHYTQWLVHGDPTVKLIGRCPPPTVEGFWAKARPEGECLVWQGAHHEGGYGRVRWGGRTRPAHRVAFELAVGPIPEGLELDHLCRTPACINPEHLEPVTRAENLRRGTGAEVTRQRHAARRAAATTGGQ